MKLSQQEFLQRQSLFCSELLQFVAHFFWNISYSYRHRHEHIMTVGPITCTAFGGVANSTPTFD